MRRILCAVLVFLLPAAASASTLVFCSEGMPETVSPPLATTTTGINAGRQIFDYLLDVKPGTTELIPSLAESWTISPDGHVYTFRLREGVEFHSTRQFTPTRPMNADDVLFSFNRQLQPDHPFHDAPGGAFPYFEDTGMPDLLKSVEKVDTMTVRMTLTRPDATFLANLALPLSAIMPAEYAEALLAQGDYRAAANQFLENYTSDPNNARAPASLLQLGKALNGLGEREAACSSLDELFGAYPNVDGQIRAAAEREREVANCA